MTPESILDAAIKIPTPKARAMYLDEVCGTDARLRKEIDTLLRAHEGRGEFMNQPAPEQTDIYSPGSDTTRFSLHTYEQIGPYKLREKLGEGGMGTVYVADQKEPVQRRVAIKLIKGGSDSRSLMARFEQERQALAMMDHPNIAKVFDAGIANVLPSPLEGEGSGVRGIPYFVMELIKGVPITKYCDDAKLTPQERLELFIPVCQAVQHAHQKGIIHRDLKPSNILIGLYDGKPIPKVIDFGVAKAIGSPLTEQSIYTEVGSLIGTLEYMSPEQAELNNLDIDTRTDIYALGIILYELLTGTVPFSQKEFAQAGMVKMLMMIKEVEPPKPSTRLSHSGSLPSIAATRKMEPKKLTSLMRGDLDWIIMKTLEKERNRRYETANALAADIQRYLNNDLVLAARPSVSYRVRKFIRRNKLAALAALIVATTIVATALIQTWSLLRAINAEKLAVKETEEKSRALNQAIEERKEKETALLSVVKERDARDAALQKSDGLRLAAEATLLRRANPGLSMLLGMEAVKRYPHHLTYDSLFGAAAECRELTKLPLKDHEAKLIRVSPNKKFMLTAGERYDSTGFRHGVVVLWDVATLKPLHSWNGLCASVKDVDWNKDGKKIAVISSGNTTVYFENGPKKTQVRLTSRVAHIVDASTGKELYRLHRHDSGIETVRFSPDGKKLVTAAADGVAKVWDADTGKLLQTLPCGKQSLKCALFSPDSKLILTVASNRSTYSSGSERSSTENKAEVIEDPVDISGLGRPMGYSTGGSGWSSGAMSNPIARVWDAETGKEVAALKKKSPNLINALLERNHINSSPVNGWFTHDSKQAVIAHVQQNSDLAINYWDVATGGFEKKDQVFFAGANVVDAAPDLSQMAAGNTKGLVKFWSSQPNKELRSNSAHEEVIQKLNYSPDGKMLLVASSKNQTSWVSPHLDVVETQTGNTIAQLRGHDDLTEAAFHPDGKHVLSVGGGSLRLWSLDAVPPVARQIPTLPPVATESHTMKGSIFSATTVARTFTSGQRLSALAFSADGKQLFVGNDDQTASVWDVFSGKHLASTKSVTGGSITHAEFHSSGEVTLADDHTFYWKGFIQGTTPANRSAVQRWNWRSEPEKKFLNNQSFGVRYFRWSQDRSRLLLVSNGSMIDAKGGQINRYGKQYLGQGCGGEVSVWDAASGNRQVFLPDAAERDSKPMFCDQDRSILMCPESVQYIGKYDAATGKLLRQYDVKSHITGSWRHAVLTHDESMLIGRRQYHDSPVNFWDARTGEPLGKVDLPGASGAFYLLELSPDSRYLAVGVDAQLVLIDVASRKIVHTLRGHENVIRCMEFSGDSRFLVTGSEDRSAVLWNVATGKVVHVYKGHPEAVMNVAISPKGTHLATQSTDALIRLWPTDLLPLFENRIERTLTDQERQRYELPVKQQSK